MLSLSAGDVLFFSEGIGLKIVPVMKADGTLGNTYEMLAGNAMKALMTREKNKLTTQARQIDVLSEKIVITEIEEEGE